MGIIDLQRRLAEVGRIRLGEKVPMGQGKSRPARLGTFRLTSPDRHRINAAAKLYGGKPEPWNDAPVGPQWQVTTESDYLPCIVPPRALAFTQWYEQWSGGGCQRRCDGQRETISDGPCLCDPDARECKPHTRLSVMLRDLPGVGLWRVDTQGWFAAMELGDTVEFFERAGDRGIMLPAVLRLDQRIIKRPGEDTKRFVVPVLDTDYTPGQLLGGQPLPAIEDGDRPAALPPVEENLHGNVTPVPDENGPAARWPTGSVAEQTKAVGNKPPAKRSSRSAAPVPRTGIEARRPSGGGQAAGKRGPGSAATVAPPPPPEPAPSDTLTGPEPERQEPIPEPDTEQLAYEAQMDEAYEAETGDDEDENGQALAQIREMEAQQERQRLEAMEAEAEQAATAQQARGRAATGEPKINQSQRTKLQTMLKEEGFPDTPAGRQRRLEWLAQAVGHPVASVNDLTKDEAREIMDFLEQAREQDKRRGGR